jgi:phenylacetate-CoA ligase
MTIWNPEYESMPREEISQLQLERLQATLNRAYRSVAYYHKLFDSIEFAPEDLLSLDDLAMLPFTSKDDIRAHYPYGMFAVPLREVVRLHTTSAPSSRQIVVGYTANDINSWNEVTARVLTAGGVTADDVVQIAFPYGLFTSGFGLHFGAEKIGASVIPTSSAKTGRQLDILTDYRSTVLVAPPSVALALADHVEEKGIDTTTLHLRSGLFSSEPWTDALRVRLQERLKISATDNYGVSEIIGPGVAGECPEKNGLHIQEDHFIAEIVDPVTGEVLPEGSEGELVLTTISKEAFPLIRFRTGDLTSLQIAACPCGRTQAKMAKVLGRTDDMLSVRGIHFYPSQIGDILVGVEGVRPGYRLHIKREDGRDLLEILVEVSEEIFFDEMKKQREMIEAIGKAVLDEVGVTAKVRLVEPRPDTARKEEGPLVRDERPR